MTPAEERAEREGMLVVLALASDMIYAASGEPMIIGTVDGQEMLLRLPTIEEFRTVAARGAERLRAMGIEPPADPPDERVAELVAPLMTWGDAE